MTLALFPDTEPGTASLQALAALRLALAPIATAAPLGEKLQRALDYLTLQAPHACALLVLDRSDIDQTTVRVGAAINLPADYPQRIAGLAAELAVWANQQDMHQLASTSHTALCEQALQQASRNPMLLPIRSAQETVLGVCVLYPAPAQSPGAALDDVLALAAIILERESDRVRAGAAELALQQRETRVALAISGSGTGVWDRNVSTGEMHYSAGWKAILGYAEDELSSRIEEGYTRVHPEDLAGVQAAIQAHFDQHTDSYAVEHRILCKDGSYKWIASRGRVVSRDASGQPLRMTGTTHDISVNRALSDRLQRSVDLITCLTNDVPGLVYQYQQGAQGEGFFPYVSQGIGLIYEVAPEQIVHSDLLICQRIHPDDLAAYRASLTASATSLTPWQLAYRVVLPKQGVRWRQGDAQPRRLPDGSTLWHGFITDVTERKRVETELQEFATIDFLTGLPNRRHFMARMDEQLVRLHTVAGARAVVLMCDLDHFKLINDRYGHATGDLALKHFAAILRQGLRKGDTVGRVGGEEFAVILSGASVTEANGFAQRVQRQIAADPLVTDESTILLTVSIGIADMKISDQSADLPLSRSDLALYRAKEEGRNRIVVALS